MKAWSSADLRELSEEQRAWLNDTIKKRSLKEAGVKLPTLKAAEWSVTQCSSAGFTNVELDSAGFKPALWIIDEATLKELGSADFAALFEAWSPADLRELSGEQRAWLLTHSKSLRQEVASGKSETIESEHPHKANETVFQSFKIDGASALLVAFDENTSINESDTITFYKDDKHGEFWGENKYSGQGADESNLPGLGGRPQLRIPADNFVFHFKSGSVNKDKWGYRFIVKTEGFNPSLKEIGVKLSKLKEAEWSVTQCASAGFTSVELDSGKFRPAQWVISVDSLKEVAHDAFAALTKAWSPTDLNALSEEQRAWLNATHSLKELGSITVPTLKNANWTAGEVRRAGFTPFDMAGSYTLGDWLSRRTEWPFFEDCVAAGVDVDVLASLCGQRGHASGVDSNAAWGDFETIESEHPYKANEHVFQTFKIAGAYALLVAFDEKTFVDYFSSITFYKDDKHKEFWGEEKYTIHSYLPGVGGRPPLRISADNFVFHVRPKSPHAAETAEQRWGYRLTVKPADLSDAELRPWIWHKQEEGSIAAWSGVETIESEHPHKANENAELRLSWSPLGIGAKTAHINFSGKQLNDTLAIKLAAWLPSHLETLDLSNNNIGDAGIERLATALPQHLETLDLSNNNIGDAGIERLATALPQHLAALDLSGNPRISEEGFRVLATTTLPQKLTSANFKFDNARKSRRLETKLGYLLNTTTADSANEAARTAAWGTAAVIVAPVVIVGGVVAGIGLAGHAAYRTIQPNDSAAENKQEKQ